MNHRLRLRFAPRIAITAMAVLGVPVLLLAGASGESTQGEQSVAEMCSGDRFPTNLPNPVQCCQDGHRTWHTNDNRVLSYRTYGEACREADGVGTNCGVGSTPFVPCAYGPCGAKTEWAIEAEDVQIFEPMSKPTKCGWEVLNIIACRVTADPDGCAKIGGTRSYPEPYTDQTLYSRVTSTCPFRRCLVGGVPAE
jgi:hypothetical protein